MLGEIYAWFTSNMKGRTMNLHESPQEPQRKPQGLTFSLHPGSLESYDCICDNASFNFEWLENTNNPVFKCNCQLRRTAHGDIHDEELAQYFSMFINASSSSCIDLIPRLVCPMSLIVRLDGLAQSWKIWLSSGRTSRLTSLIIRNISPTGMQGFVSYSNGELTLRRISCIREHNIRACDHHR